MKTKLRYLKIAPRKTRAVANTIRGLPVNEAMAQLMFSPRRPAQPLLKLLRSAVANAKTNHKIEAEKLFVSELKIDGGPKAKRWTPRARGAVNLIERKTSHITMTLGVSDKLPASGFRIKPPVKKVKSVKPAKDKEAKVSSADKTAKEKKRSTSTGFFKRIFRRKSI